MHSQRPALRYGSKVAECSGERSRLECLYQYNWNPSTESRSRDGFELGMASLEEESWTALPIIGWTAHRTGTRSGVLGSR